MKKRDVPKNIPKQSKNNLPIIPGAEEKTKIKKRFFSISNGTERMVLMKKWLKTMTLEEAKKKWNKICLFQKELYHKLIKKGLSHKDATNKLNEELAKEYG